MASLENKIEQWKSLKSIRKTLDSKLDVLRKDILENLGDGPVYGVQKQVRDLTSLDEEAAWEILEQVADTPSFTKLVLDPDKIEGLYLEGLLTDTDLRAIRNPKYIEARVEVKADVQEIN